MKEKPILFSVPMVRAGLHAEPPEDMEMKALSELPSVRNYSLQSMVERAVKNARPHQCGEAPRWVAVMDTFALGSTFAGELCRIYGLDPDEKVIGPRCLACEQE